MSGPYKAVDVTELRQTLGHQCSPMIGKGGYVIGPAANGRLCHVATCDTLREAQSVAAQYNEKHAGPTKEYTYRETVKGRGLKFFSIFEVRPDKTLWWLEDVSSEHMAEVRIALLRGER